MKSRLANSSPRRSLTSWTPLVFALVPLTVMLWVMPATAAVLAR